MGILAFLLYLLTTPAMAQQLAFPGAEGYGRFAVGGRGGVVYPVTNLNDSGSGSLRQCVQANGPRTCVFRVGGTIVTASGIRTTNPFLTIAGETAPPPGITIVPEASRDGDPLVIDSSDVIVRFITLQSDKRAGSASTTRDGLSVTDLASNVILDHLTIRYGVDEILEIKGCDVTVQNTVIAWGLERAGHVKGKHSKGLLAQNPASGCDLSLIRSLLAHANDRMPDIQNFDNIQVVNTIIYNPDTEFGEFRVTAGTTNLDYISSVCKKGPATVGTVPYCVDLKPASPGTFQFYREDVVAPMQSGVLPPDDTAMEVRARHSMPPVEVVWPASSLEANLLPVVGRTLPIRDAIDRMLVQEVQTGTGSLLNSAHTTVPRSVHDEMLDEAFNAVQADRLDQAVDTDGDGISDKYEVAHPELDPSNPADGSTITIAGYTHLEHYLHALAAKAEP